MDASKWADVIAIGNQSALQWYATLSGKPIQSGQPQSVMRDVLGADLGAGPTALGQAASPIGIVVVLGIVVAGVVLLARR